MASAVGTYSQIYSIAANGLPWLWACCRNWPSPERHNILLQGFDAVLSDMCNATTGISAVDAARSLQLADLACSVAIGDAEQQRSGVLVPGGNLLVKLLEVCSTSGSTDDAGSC
jgi:23S rRNA U2552 (ribose-2'-O)-methylase RlmE/FtsJ